MEKSLIYAGIIIGKNGAKDQHIFLLSEQIKNVDWIFATEWAKSLDASLPNKREQILMLANMPEMFDDGWYWSEDQVNENSAQAFIRKTSGSYQISGSKLHKGRACAVLRVDVEFNQKSN